MAAGECLGRVMYDPAVATTLVSGTSLRALSAIDTTNLRIAFTAPPSGNVRCRVKIVNQGGATAEASWLLGVVDSGGAVIGRMSPSGGLTGVIAATTLCPLEVKFVVTGLTPGNTYTWDAAAGVEVTFTNSHLKAGGPDTSSSLDALASALFEIHEA